MLKFVDTHCHIQSINASSGERNTIALWAKNSELTQDNVVERAKSAGVEKLICVGCDLIDSKLAINYVADRKDTYASIGLHPHEAAKFYNNLPALSEFSTLAKKDKVIAIGECGLDYYYMHSDKKMQVSILEYQLNLAVKNNLPVIFHIREAFSDFWPVFNNFKNLRGVLHSYTDSLENLNLALEHDLYIGVNGIATFSKDENLNNVYKAVPIDKLLLETDAPYLTPIPYRGTINEPMRLVVTAEYLANLRGVNLDNLAKATSSNAAKLFKI